MVGRARQSFSFRYSCLIITTDCDSGFLFVFCVQRAHGVLVQYWALIDLPPLTICYLIPLCYYTTDTLADFSQTIFFIFILFLLQLIKLTLPRATRLLRQTWGAVEEDRLR